MWPVYVDRANVDRLRGAARLLYDEWRRSFDSMDRGSQLWDTRRRVYHAIAHRTDARPPTIAKLLADSGISRQAFYNHFGIEADTKLVDDEPIVVGIVEAKEWSFAPYRHGVRDVTGEVPLAPRALLEVVLRAAAEWALDFPAVAGYLNARPPTTAVLLVAHALAELGGNVEAADDLVRAAVRRAGDAVLAEASLGTLNALRPAIDSAVGDSPASDANQQTATVVEVLSDYAQHLLTGGAPPAGDAEVRALLDRLRSLLADVP